MITIGLCLIYYGVALFGYQLYGWFADDEWASYTVMSAWINLFGRPDLSFPIVGPITEWFMEWPLSLSFIALGLSVLCSIAGFRQHTRLRLDRMRAKWFAENAIAAGYKPWTINKVTQDFRKSVLNREAKGRAGLD